MDDRELLDADREWLLDFFDGERLVDFFEGDRLLDRNLIGDRELDFFDREIDLDLDRDEDLDLDLLIDDFGDSLDLECDLERFLGDLDFLSLDNERNLSSLEPERERFDLLSGDNDLVYDLDGDLE